MEDSQDISGDKYLDERFLDIDDTVFQPTKEGEDGDEVSLFLFKCEMAQGIVHHVDPIEFCRGCLAWKNTNPSRLVT